MHIINLPSTNPRFNLAVEEILLRERKEEYLLLYIDSPSVIIGKHQVAHRETETEYVTLNNIPVIRRLSGGGTVFHDRGNLNFTFILQSRSGSQVDFRKYTKPVIDFLATLGIEAVFEGKNDLKVSGLKISGNAEHIHRERVLHHGTLLYDADIETMKISLRKNNSCYSTKAVASNPSAVMNLKPLLPDIRDTEDFRERMYCYFINRPGIKGSELTFRDITQAGSAAESKYGKWEWNYAYGPEYHFHNTFIMNNKEHSCGLFVRNGIMAECSIEGSSEMHDAAKRLVGCRHMPEDIGIVFSEFNMPYSCVFHLF